MKSDPAVRPGGRISLAAGRDLRFSFWPDDETCVVFDCNSGDYWIVPELSFRVLNLLGAEGSALRLDELVERVRMSFAPARDPSEVEVFVEDLIEAKLVEGGGA